jgi:hypothetical protein
MINMGIIWNSIGKKLVTEFLKKFGKEISKKKEKLIRKEFINELDNSLINKYGTQTFYNKLSKLLIQQKILEDIFDSCYKKEDYKSKRKIAEDIIKNGDFNSYERSLVIDIICNILDSTF